MRQCEAVTYNLKILEILGEEEMAKDRSGLLPLYAIWDVCSPYTRHTFLYHTAQFSHFSFLCSL